MRPRFIFLLGISLAVPAAGGAHPLSYKGALSVMAWNQPDATDWMTTYTFHRHGAVAGRYLRLNTEEGETRAGLAQINSLLKRWNGLDHQANVYLSVGAGAAERGSDRREAAFASLQADHESRRHLILASGDVLKPRGSPAIHRWEARAGLAPYLSDFDEVSSWLILSLQGQPQAERDLMLVPLVRVFYRNVLGELGAAPGGDWMFNFMFHF